jgi:hypothetical protein
VAIPARKTAQNGENADLLEKSKEKIELINGCSGQFLHARFADRHQYPG